MKSAFFDGSPCSTAICAPFGRSGGASPHLMSARVDGERFRFAGAGSSVLAASAAKAGLAASKTNEIVAANVFIGGLLVGMAAKLITRTDTGTPCAQGPPEPGAPSAQGSSSRSCPADGARRLGFLLATPATGERRPVALRTQRARCPTTLAADPPARNVRRCERLVGFHARRQRLQHRLLGFLEVMGGDVHHVERRVLGALGVGL